jgi:hypothetical protein
VLQAITTSRLKLNGLSPNLNISIAAGVVYTDGGFVRYYPANPGTLNIIPFQETSDRFKILLKPLTLTPPVLPCAFGLGAGWRIGGNLVNTELGINQADGCLVEITIDPAGYVGEPIAGNLIVSVNAEYNGSWWDVEAISRLIGAVNISGTDKILRVQSAGS